MSTSTRSSTAKKLQQVNKETKSKSSKNNNNNQDMPLTLVKRNSNEIDIEETRKKEGKRSTSSGKASHQSSIKKTEKTTTIEQLPTILLISPLNESRVLFTGRASVSSRSSEGKMNEIKTPDWKIGKTKRNMFESFGAMSEANVRIFKTEPKKMLIGDENFEFSAKNLIKRVKLNTASTDSKSKLNF